LIELLVVIAIIAILTAILLPVFASVREGARQSTSISNMKDIQQKMEQFKLDNHRYPDVLFGYSDGSGSMKGALGRAQARGNDPATGKPIVSYYFPGLYPAYIKDVEVFTDPNNTVNSSDSGKYTGPVSANTVAPCSVTADEYVSTGTTTPASSSPCTTSGSGTSSTPAAGSIVSTTRSFYLADAYDSSPVVTGTNTISTTPIVRYQLAREQTVASGTTPDASYSDQLRWQNPPANTLITATTYHVPNADKVLAMFESGAVKKITGHDFAALEGPSTAPTFWQVANYPDNLKP
jgi:type II secretory pathway pseudopilin PulG